MMSLELQTHASGESGIREGGTRELGGVVTNVEHDSSLMPPLQHTGAYIPITWVEGIAMQKKVRKVMDACLPDERHMMTILESPKSDHGHERRNI